MLKYLLNKGGAGVSLSRQKTVDRLNPLLKNLVALNHIYDDAVGRISDVEVARQLEQFLKIARTDVAKLSETIYSAGGRAYTGTDVEPGSLHAGDRDEDTLPTLRDRENEFLNTIKAEDKLKHQIRTQAILANVRTNSLTRFNFLDEFSRKSGRRDGRK